jgi:hypothetical protein
MQAKQLRPCFVRLQAVINSAVESPTLTPLRQLDDSLDVDSGGFVKKPQHRTVSSQIAVSTGQTQYLVTTTRISPKPTVQTQHGTHRDVDSTEGTCQ